MKICAIGTCREDFRLIFTYRATAESTVTGATIVQTIKNFYKIVTAVRFIFHFKS